MPQNSSLATESGRTHLTANAMAAKESLVIFYSVSFYLPQDCENKTLKKSDYITGHWGNSTSLTFDWEIVRQFKYSENNVIYKHHKSENQVQGPRRGDTTRIVDHTSELEAFFKAFDSALEVMIEKLTCHQQCRCPRCIG